MPLPPGGHPAYPGYDPVQLVAAQAQAAQHHHEMYVREAHLRAQGIDMQRSAHHHHLFLYFLILIIFISHIFLIFHIYQMLIPRMVESQRIESLRAAEAG
jgi:hypothetical protein